MSSENAKFPKFLKSARENRKLTQAELAQKTGLQPTAISHFEASRRSPSFDNLRKLADALQVTTDYLLGREQSFGTSSPAMQALFRNAENMTENDLNTLQDFAKMLADKNKPK